MSSREPRLFPVRSPRPRRGRTRRGFDATLAALRARDGFPAHLEGLAALGRVLADELDAATLDDDETRFVRSRVAATYQAALLGLLDRVGLEGPTDGALAALLAELGDDLAPALDLEAPGADAPALSHPA